MRHEVFPPEGERRPLIDRHGERLPFDLFADIKAGSGAWKRARLTDMSTSGFRIAWFPNARAGQTVMIRIPGIEALNASVRRAGPAGIGCEFASPLSIYVLDHLAHLSH
jgi:hypothetical protein